MFSRFLLSLFLKPATLRQPQTRLFWQAVLALSGGVMTLTLACIAPFSAIAVLASRTLTMRRAIVATCGAVVANQLVGFAVLGYPRTLATLAWGPVFLCATLVALWTARRIARAPVAFAAAFVAYEAVLAAYTYVTEHALGAFAPAIVGQVALANILGLAVLGLLYIAIVAVERGTSGRERNALDLRR
jgi:hypothetical protein